MKTIKFFDPHFHLWTPHREGDREETDSWHDADTAKTSDGRIYDLAAHLATWNRVPIETDVTFECTGGIAVEAISACFPDRKSHEMIPLAIKEAAWVSRCIHNGLANGHASGRFGIVSGSFFDVPRVDSIGEMLDALGATIREVDPALRLAGIRQIWNYKPSHPRNHVDLLSGLSTDGDPPGEPAVSVISGLEEVFARNLVFDLQCNPHQLSDATTVLSISAANAAARHAATAKGGTFTATVVLDHIGTPKPPDVVGWTVGMSPADAARCTTDATQLRADAGAPAAGTADSKETTSASREFHRALAQYAALDTRGCCTKPDATSSLDRPDVATFQVRTFLKVSLLHGIDRDGDFDKQPLNTAESAKAGKPMSPVAIAVHEMIRLFGARRCMFATNNPPDGLDGWSIPRILRAFYRIAAEYPEEEREWLFERTARNAYGYE